MQRKTEVTETIILGKFPNEITIRLTHQERELPDRVAFKVESNEGPLLEVSLPTEILERVAKAVENYRETIKWGTNVCPDHGYHSDGTYSCPHCKAEKHAPKASPGLVQLIEIEDVIPGMVKP